MQSINPVCSLYDYQLFQVENSLLVPVSLYDYVHYTDGNNRERMVMVPVMFDSPPDQEAPLPAQRLNRVSQPDVLLRAHNFLAYQCMNSYVEADTARLMQQLGSIQSQHQNVVNLASPLVEGVVEQNRTNLRVISSVFLPDQSVKEMDIVNFLNMKHPYAKAMPLFFPDGQGDFDSADRVIKVSETDFVNHYLRNARKQLVEFSPFIFHSLFRIESFKASACIHSPRGGYLIQDGATSLTTSMDPGSKFRLSKLTGSSSYYSRIHEDLHAKCDQLGYPEFFYTFSNSDQWDVTLATALSQDGFDVWHVNDEAHLLGRDPEQQAQRAQYFVHLHPSLAQNCPFHSSKYS